MHAFIIRAVFILHGIGVLTGYFVGGAAADAGAGVAESAITEAQFIEKVLAQDKLLEEARIGLDIKQIELDASRDNYANWQTELSAEVGYEYTDDNELHYSRSSGALSTSPFTRIAKESPREVSLDFSKRFLWSPGSLRAGVSRGKNTIRNTRYDRDFNSRCGTAAQRPTDVCQSKPVFEEQQNYAGYSTEYYVQINYPLLKHDGNAESRKSYQRNILDLQDQRLSFFETKENFLHDRLEDFLEWYRQYGVARIHRETLAALRALTATDAADAALLESAIAQAENFAREAEIQARAIQQQLAILLNNAAILHMTPRFNLRRRAKLVSGNLADYLRAHSRALRRIHNDMQLNEIEIAHHQNRLLPALDLTLRVDRAYNKLGTATQTYDDTTTDYEAHLEFSYPLGGGISTKAELEKRALTKRRLEIAYAERLERLQADLQRLTSLLDLDETRLLDAIAAADESALLEYDEYHAADGNSPRDLIQAYRDARDAKLEHIDRVVEYHLNRLAYDNLLDRIIGDAAAAVSP